MEEYGVVVDVLQEVLACRLTVCVKLDLAVFVVQVQQSVQLVVAHPLKFFGGGLTSVRSAEGF